MIEAVALATILYATPARVDRELAVARPSRYVSAIRSASSAPPKFRDWAACVLKRETGAVLHNKKSRQDARNPTSSAAGRWQFLAAWRNGLPYMVRERLIEHGMPTAQATTVRKFLSDRPIHKWPGVYQDVGAFEVMERGGAFHWRGHSCGLP